jgi:hypothetical protein
LLGTATRSDGNAKVTYNGHPLYTYVGDQRAGQTNGQGITAFGGSWFTLNPSGTQASGATPGEGTSSTGGSAATSQLPNRFAQRQ